MLTLRVAVGLLRPERRESLLDPGPLRQPKRKLHGSVKRTREKDGNCEQRSEESPTHDRSKREDLRVANVGVPERDSRIESGSRYRERVAIMRLHGRHLHREVLTWRFPAPLIKRFSADESF